MEITALLNKIKENQQDATFDEVIACVDAYYTFTPTKFTNGQLLNEAGQNSGSCKVFAFGKLHGLSKEQTLHCFGDYYRKDVLNDPEGDGHQNIRNFIKTGWEGINFEGDPLTEIES